MSTVAVLKGGRSLERQVSLRSGARVEDALARLGHDVVGIDVGGDLVTRLRDARPDVVFIALHGRDGEDGTVQELLEVLGIPYTASGVSACMRTADKVATKHLLQDAGLPTPDFFSFTATAFKELAAADALAAIVAACSYSSRVLLERHVHGRELAVSVLGDDALPIVEAIPREE